MSSASSEFVSQSEIVRAGAGAGKTYSLTHRVMDLADEFLRVNGRLPRLVVTTFTRKATQELRERLMLLALEERPHLLAFVTSRAYLMVSTIHGVMDIFLKRHGAVLPLEPGFRFLSNPEAAKLSRQTLRAILVTGGVPNDDPTRRPPEWNRLLEKFSFHNLVKFCRRIDQIRAENPGARPFTLQDMVREFQARAEHAALEMAAVSLRIRSETDKPNWLAIADSMSRLASLLKNERSWEDKRAEFIQGFQDFPPVRRPGKGVSPVALETIERAKECRELAKKLLEPNGDPQFWRLSAEIGERMEALSREFSARLRQTKLSNGTIEISDLEILAMECLRKSPEAAASFAAEWDYWLIDEFQDTSPFQVALIDQVVADRPKFIVGDPQQSIYLFRGARSEVFHEREEEIASAGGKSRTLSVNRRSRPELLQFINDLFTSFKPPFRAMDPHFVGQEVYRSGDCVATFFVAPKDDDLDGPAMERDEPGAEVNPGSGTVVDAELMAIVTHVQGLIAAGARLDEIAVLARTKKTLLEVAEILGQYQLAAHVHAGAGFYDRREVRDALAFLKFLANPHDDFILIELARSPWFQISDDDLSAARKRSADSLWLSITGSPAVGEPGFDAVVRLKSALQDCTRIGYAEAFRHGLIHAGYIDFSQAGDVSGRREANLWKLLMRLREEETKPGFNPIEFVRSTMTELKLEEGNAEDDAVAAVEPSRINLLTVHAAKGLEFKHVIVPRLHARPRLTTFEDLSYDEDFARWALRIPFGDEGETSASLCAENWIQRFQRAEIEEHARVLYVALTRAIDSVYLSWSGDPQGNSWASLLRVDLGEGTHSSPYYTYQVLRKMPEPQPPSEIAIRSAEPRRMWSERNSKLAAFGHVSVTDLVAKNGLSGSASLPLSGSATLPLSSSASLPLSSSASLRRLQASFRSQAVGTGVHRLLELLKYPMSNERRRGLIEKWFPDRADEVADAIAFVENCQRPPLLEMIRRGEVEWGFALLDGGQVVEGQIDLWARVANGELWIVDYKTGSDEYQEKAFLQMSIYARALLKAGIARVDETIFCAAVYPFAGRVIVRQVAKLNASVAATTTSPEYSPDPIP